MTRMIGMIMNTIHQGPPLVDSAEETEQNYLQLLNERCYSSVIKATVGKLQNTLT